MKDKHNKLEKKWGVNKHTKMTLNLECFFNLSKYHGNKIQLLMLKSFK